MHYVESIPKEYYSGLVEIANQTGNLGYDANQLKNEPEEAINLAKSILGNAIKRAMIPGKELVENVSNLTILDVFANAQLNEGQRSDAGTRGFNSTTGDKNFRG